VEIGLLFRKVRDTVFSDTHGQQEPFTYGSLPAEALFSSLPRKNSLPPVAQHPKEEALKFVVPRTHICDSRKLAN
jgi:hypothetical protein